jgi:hypothetical protein
MIIANRHFCSCQFLLPKIHKQKVEIRALAFRAMERMLAKHVEEAVQWVGGFSCA